MAHLKSTVYSPFILVGLEIQPNQNNSELKTTTITNCCIHTVVLYLLMMGYKFALKYLEVDRQNILRIGLPVLLNGNEMCTIEASDARRITAAELKSVRRTAGYTGGRL